MFGKESEEVKVTEECDPSALWSCHSPEKGVTL